MITTKIYEKDNDMIAVVLEDGQYSNYIPCPEIAAFDAESFLEEARLGFPDAPLYEFDSMIGLSMEEAAALIEREGTLIALADETITIYPQRMGQDQQEFFQMELGEEAWQALLEQASGSEGIQVEI